MKHVKKSVLLWYSPQEMYRLVTSVEDLELVTVKAMGGTPIYLKDIATVQIGGDFRRGALDINGQEAVGGTVVMRTGENAKAVIERVKERVAQIQSSLPPGITIKPFYDRSELIDNTIGTLKHALIEEIILVTLAHIIFLWHFRSILIVTLPLPISILISFLLMKEFGIKDPVQVRATGMIDLPTTRHYLNAHFSVAIDLFGADQSSNAATFYSAGLKGR